MDQNLEAAESESGDASFKERLQRVIFLAGGAIETARICGVSRGTVYLWTGSSESKAPFVAVAAIAAAAGVSLDWLATGNGPEPGAPENKSQRATPARAKRDCVSACPLNAGAVVILPPSARRVTVEFGAAVGDASAESSASFIAAKAASAAEMQAASQLVNDAILRGDGPPSPQEAAAALQSAEHPRARRAGEQS